MKTRFPSAINWKLDLIALGLVALSWGMMSLCGVAHGGENDSAATLMKQAHAGRAVWQNFPGFQAKVRVSTDGKVADGVVQVSETGAVKLDLPGAGPFPWAERTLKSVVGHRLSDEAAIQSVTFADVVTTNPLGRLLKSTDDGDKSLWRVQGDILNEVHRFRDKSHFVISVVDVTRNSERRHLPRNFTVTTWDNATGQIASTRQVYNEWTRVGHLDLPTKLLAVNNKSDGSHQVEQIELTDHQLLPLPSAAR